MSEEPRRESTAGATPTEPVASEDAARAQTAYAAGAEDPAFVGRLVENRYRVLRPLAQGGMGSVYVAEHLSLHKEVALKVIRPEFAENEEIAVRFAREAIAMAQFEHPHVASAIDYGALPEGGAFLVMPLLRGTSLRQLLQAERRLPWRRACAIGAQVADALSAARVRGIVHRDLKPDNLLVESREDGSDLVKILDFGIARMENHQGPDEALPGQALTRVGMVMGTPGYMAPEQAVGDQLDHRADLYALGVVLWEAIAGRDLWTGEDITAIIAKQMREAAPPLRSVVQDPTLPDGLEDLLQQLMARNASERPDHPGDVRDVLRALSLSASGDWGRTRLLTGLGHAASNEVGVGPVAGWLGETLRPFPRLQRASLSALTHAGRRPWAVAGGLVLALVCGMWLWSGDDQAVATAASPGPAVAEERPAALPPPAAQGNAEPKGVLDKVVAAAGKAVEPALRAASAATEPSVPAELEAPVKDMLESNRLRERRTAARTILEYQPRENLPAYLVPIAEFEATGNCGKRRAALQQMVRIGDVRARPVVERYHDTRHGGCGLLGLSDCLRCIRGDLRDALAGLPSSS